MTDFQARLYEIISLLEQRKIDAYGVSINEEYIRLHDREPSSGRLYTNLNSMVEQELLTATIKAINLEKRGGRHVRVYNITQKGHHEFLKHQGDQSSLGLGGVGEPGLARTALDLKVSA